MLIPRINGPHSCVTYLTL